MKMHPKCDICKKSLENLDTLNIHILSAHSQETVQCETCKEDVANQGCSQKK